MIPGHHIGIIPRKSNQCVQCNSDILGLSLTSAEVKDNPRMSELLYYLTVVVLVISVFKLDISSCLCSFFLAYFLRKFQFLVFSVKFYLK